MHMKTRNVNTGFRELVDLFDRGSRRPVDEGISRASSRNGPVMYIQEPVTITYTHPKERVLFNQARDANPHFHLYEALWMLAGRNDVAPVAYYAENMKNYSDDGKTLNGAYGYRWRNHKFCEGQDEGEIITDQLKVLINHLKADHTSRRAVLQMWNVEQDLLKIGQPNPRGEIGAYRIGDKIVPSDASKDVTCNLSVMFSIRRDPGHMVGEQYKTANNYLDMTVTNRSNDLIWGCLGANVVHFSFLLEYMAAHLGVQVGLYHHFTNNLHIYESNWKPEEWLGYEEEASYTPTSGAEKIVKPFQLVVDPQKFDEELPKFVEMNWVQQGGMTPMILEPVKHQRWKEPFLDLVAQKMCNAFHCHKAREYDNALHWCSEIQADDWRIAATNWITKRKNNYENRKERPEIAPNGAHASQHVHEEVK